MEPAPPVPPLHPGVLPWNAGDTTVPSQGHGSNQEPPHTTGMECGSSERELEQALSGDRVPEQGREPRLLYQGGPRAGATAITLLFAPSTHAAE